MYSKRVNISLRYLSVGPFIRLYFAKLVAVSKIKCMQMSVCVCVCCYLTFCGQTKLYMF